MPRFENNFAARGAPILSSRMLRDHSDRSHITWKHIADIRRIRPRPFVIKGILGKDDALAACDSGADGLIVSNHGDRQLDCSVASLRALPGSVAAAGTVPVMLDSGIRRGADVLKAIALGARMAFVGRPFAYAAAVGGEAGVALGPWPRITSSMTRNGSVRRVPHAASIKTPTDIHVANILYCQSELGKCGSKVYAALQ